MGIRAESGIDHVTEKLPRIYAQLLELRHEEPRLAKRLTRKLKQTIDLYEDLLRRLEAEMRRAKGASRAVANERRQAEAPVARKLELQIANLGDLAAYSRKRALLRKQAILQLLADSHPNPAGGAEIAEEIVRRGLADNAPTVTTHISRMRNLGLIKSLASGVFSITDAGRAELGLTRADLNVHWITPVQRRRLRDGRS